MAPEKGWTKSDPLRHGESTRCRVGDADVTWTYTPINAYVTYGGRTLNVTLGRSVDLTALAEDLAEEWAVDEVATEYMATERVANARLACDGELHERWYWVILST